MFIDSYMEFIYIFTAVFMYMHVWRRTINLIEHSISINSLEVRLSES